MEKKSKVLRLLIFLGVILLQLFLSRLVPYIFFIFYPIVEVPAGIFPLKLIIWNGIASFAGVFFAGWMAIVLCWMLVPPKLLLRALLTLAGTILPILITIFIYDSAAPSSGLLWLIPLLSVFGFHAPSLFKNNQT